MSNEKEHHKVENTESRTAHDIPSKLIDHALSLLSERGGTSSSAKTAGESLAPGMDSKCIQQLDELSKAAPQRQFDCSANFPGPPTKVNQCAAEIPSAPAEVSHCSYHMPKPEKK